MKNELDELDQKVDEALKKIVESRKRRIESKKEEIKRKKEKSIIGDYENLIRGPSSVEIRWRDEELRKRWSYRENTNVIKNYTGLGPRPGPFVRSNVIKKEEYDKGHKDYPLFQFECL